MAKLRSMDESIVKFAAEGYQFPGLLSELPGRIISMAGTLFYICEYPITGYPLAEARTKLGRVLMGQIVGRALKTYESVKFKTPNHKDFRLANLRVTSRDMPAKQLYECNQEPVLGYSHCLCKCGQELDLEQQKQTPHSYIAGHSPADARRKETVDASLQVSPHKKTRRRKLPTKEQARKIGTDLSKLEPKESIITEQTEQVLDLERERFRPVFMAAIAGLPWKEFEELLECLLKIKERQKP